MEQEEQADYTTLRLGSPTGPDQEAQPPSFVTLSPFPPISTPSSRRRLSSQFTPSRAVPLARRLARVSLQGRLVDAEEASSAKAIGLSGEAGVAWELFSPVQRFLIVAVIGVAVSESKKNRIINQLKKSVELRDQVLSSMQQKLDDLCDQLSSINNQAGTKGNASFNNNKNLEPPCNDVFGCDKIKFVDCGCWHCDQHHDLLAGLMGNSVVKVSKGDEMLQYKMPFINEVEQEERRMSDLSDWASSVTSAAEMQMNTYAIDQDMFNLKRECEEKDATIKELNSILQTNNMTGSKRIAELEDIIRRKNTMITRLRKDMMVLEQKVVHLTRLRRPSSSLCVSDSSELPLMVDNIIYDMDSTTSPSSSDSDSSPANRPQTPAAHIQETPVQSSELGLTKSQKSAPAKASSSVVELHKKSRSESPLKEISTNQKSIGLPSSRPKQLSAEIRKARRRTQSAIKDASSKKRWFYFFNPAMNLGFSARRGAPPPLVSLSLFSPVSSPTSPRLSSQFKPSQAVPSPRRLPWVDPQEQLVNEGEASSDIAIGIGFNLEENVGSELFSPIQRFLIVAALGLAVAESRKNTLINQLKKSVELRDEVLSSLEQKLDNLCDQMDDINNQEETKANDAFGCDRIEFVDGGSWQCDEHQEHVAGLVGNSAVRMPRGDEVLHCKIPFGNEEEPEEQKMSDFSDWGSTGSAEEIQKECEQKDATIKELSTDLQSFAGSKRFAELEDIICRKNTMIKRLKRNMVVLEEKAELSPRLRRPSPSLSISDNWELPVMVDNILYDLDSSSSSDSDSSPSNQPQPPPFTVQETPVQSDVLTLTAIQKPPPAKASRFSVGLTEPKAKSRSERLLTEIPTKRRSIGNSSSRPEQLSAGEDIRKIKRKGRELHAKSRAESPPKETSRNQESSGLSPSKPKQMLAGGDGRKIRRQTQSSSKDTTPKKRWL
ncbi:hypothetical protein NC651_009610 [Populus alba x Populus x berolinensis]|nr:hypothetical protein NC651_009610 [Populus alba x Populus x berolinensis]